MGKVLLEVKDLHVSFHTYAGEVKAVRGVNFHVNKGETLAIVGESGCGKTVTSKAILRILPKLQSEIKEGSKVLFDDKNLLDLSENKMRKIRGSNISMIFQDPMTSLNPTMKVGAQIAEGLIMHKGMKKTEAFNEAVQMLKLVDMPNAEKRAKQYPHEFSGGMRQRAMIAIALACKPKLLIADEPTTALDVTIQAQIMELIGDIQKELGISVMLVTHDLGVVAGVADRIQVMYAGKIVETGTVDEIFYNPQHPYLWALLRSTPTLKTANKDILYSLNGTPPDLLDPPIGCPFAARCEYCMKVCRKAMPKYITESKTHSVACWLKNPLAPKVDVPQNLLVGVND